MTAELKQVLVVEDNRLLADVLRFNLVRADFAVTVANSIRETVGHLERKPFDLVFTDFQLPDAEATVLFRHIRETMQLLDLPLIVCSAKGLELNAEQLRATWNVAKVIYKPFSVREVVVLARRLCAAGAAAAT